MIVIGNCNMNREQGQEKKVARAAEAVRTGENVEWEIRNEKLGMQGCGGRCVRRTVPWHTQLAIVIDFIKVFNEYI